MGIIGGKNKPRVAGLKIDENMQPREGEQKQTGNNRGFILNVFIKAFTSTDGT